MLFLSLVYFFFATHTIFLQIFIPFNAVAVAAVASLKWIKFKFFFMGVKTIDLNANFFSFFLYIFWFLFYIFMAIATRKIYSPYEREAFIVRINDSLSRKKNDPVGVAWMWQQYV